MTILDKLKITSIVKNSLLNPEIDKGLDELGILRFEFEISEVNILDILVKIRNGNKIYWKNRDNTFEAVATDDLIAKDYVTTEEVDKSIGTGIRFYVSNKFDSSTNTTLKWSRLNDKYIMIPFWSIERKDNQYTFVMNISRKILNEIQLKGIKSIFSFDLTFDKISQNKINILSKQQTPNFENWKLNIEKSLEMFKTKELQKIVLSRMTKYQLSDRQKPENIFTNLIQDKVGSYAFYYQMDSSTAFMGISPELLFTLADNLIVCDALAGSAPRGNTPDEDQKNADELLSNPKELWEHQLVSKFLYHRLAHFSKKIKFEHKLAVKKFQNIQHIHSSIKAKLKDDYNPLFLIEKLSPTPAVAGFPQVKALETIKELEKFDRGHYAGAIGTMAIEHSEFCVGIRSALYFDNKLYVYSGAGIVEGSEPEKEWIEIENKMKNFTEILEND